MCTKKPGTYTVTLMVDNKSSRSRTREITIYDTIPSFEISDTTLSIYHDYTLRALVYNPYNYPVSYEWVFPLNTIYVAPSDSTQSLSAASYKLYFTQAMTEAPVWLRVILNGDTTLVKKSFNVSDYHTNSVLFRTSSGDYRQRIFGKRAEMFPMPDPSARTALDTEQDTLQNYNGKTFRLSELQTTFPGLQGFKIVNRKVYFRDSKDYGWRCWTVRHWCRLTKPLSCSHRRHDRQPHLLGYLRRRQISAFHRFGQQPLHHYPAVA